MNSITATYSPEDNKLRIYSLHRLDPETYARIKEAGFKWAPKQNVFVAPMWTPAREDLCLELAGDIDDEETSLIERAGDRADRFEEYSENRENESLRAYEAAKHIADGIPFGQPILVGHHSERRARKDAARIENGMRKAVQMRDAAEYWKQRAIRTIKHAEYKDKPGVRYRRIKGLEADKRKQERIIEDEEKKIKAWEICENTVNPKEKLKMALHIANYNGHYMPRKEGDKEGWDLLPSAYTVLSNAHPELYAPRTVEEVIEEAKKQLPKRTAHARRWINHYENRITYEKTLLEAQEEKGVTNYVNQ